jgi:hypothetical protein
MNYDIEIIELLHLNKNISALWLNEDATEWHTYEVSGLKKVTRDEILKPKKKDGVK